MSSRAKQVSIRMDGQSVRADPGATVLEAGLGAGIHIPHLCTDSRAGSVGSCRLCMVKIKGQKGLAFACETQVASGMEVSVEDEELAGLRRSHLELILSQHPDAGGRLQDYANKYQADKTCFGQAQDSGPQSKKPNFASDNKGIRFDQDQCILCGLCVQFCDEIQMVGALTLAGRGPDMKVTTAFDMPLHESTCELCGGCIRVCPTGALMDRAALGQGSKDLRSVRTTCTYCGVGCQLDLMVEDKQNRILRVDSKPETVINHGNLCVKGHFGYDFVNSPDRLRDPLIKENGSFRKATWEEAVKVVGNTLREIRETHGPESIAFMSSCRCTNEENYLMQKLARAAGQTNNVDQCATTCHAPTVAGLDQAFGSGAMTNSVEEIQDCDVMFVIGANPTEAHPIIGLEMKRAMRKGAKLLVCDPRATWLALHSDVHLQIRPGSDNMLLNAMMNHIVAQGLADQDFIKKRCEDFPAFEKNLEAYPIEKAAKYCGVDAGSLRRAAEIYARGQPSAIYYTLGITEHSTGTDNVLNLANLAMLCGQIGKRASGVNPLRGQNNVQGACDMGAMPHKLPGYQDVMDPESRAAFEKVWGVSLPTNRGGFVPHFVQEAAKGSLKALYVMGEDPVMSEPNQSKVIASLQNLEFMVCQEIFMSETAKMADVILPGACSAEKDGTFTASERRVQRVRRAVAPPGQAKADWEILCMVSGHMGYPMNYTNPSQIFDEMASLNPNYRGMTYERLDAEGLQWPCPDPGHPGTRFLHQDRFTRGKGKFHPIDYQPQKEEPDQNFPLILSTGRTLYHYNSGTMSRRTAVLDQKEKHNFVEIHKETAARYGIRDGQKILVRSRRGAVRALARVAKRVRPDSLWMPFHFVEDPTNILTNDVFDPVTATAEYKCCAVRIET